MEKVKYKIGQEVKSDVEYIIKTEVSNKAITVKKGDAGFVDSRGWIHYLNGEARGKINIADVQVDGYDCENIARMIMGRLIVNYDLESVLDDYDISVDDVKEEIEDILSDIL